MHESTVCLAPPSPPPFPPVFSAAALSTLLCIVCPSLAVATARSILVLVRSGLCADTRSWRAFPLRARPQVHISCSVTSPCSRFAAPAPSHMPSHLRDVHDADRARVHLAPVIALRPHRAAGPRNSVGRARGGGRVRICAARGPGLVCFPMQRLPRFCSRACFSRLACVFVAIRIARPRPDIGPGSSEQAEEPQGRRPTCGAAACAPLPGDHNSVPLRGVALRLVGRHGATSPEQ